MKDPVLKRYRAEVLRLASEHGITRVRVFGSRSRGEGTETSDIDLLVDLEEGCSLFDMVGFQLAIQDLTGLKVDVATPSGISRFIRDRVIAEAVPLDQQEESS